MIGMKSMRKCAVLFAAVLLAAASVRAQTVDTVEVYSPSMDKKIKNVVILPAGYGRNADRPLPGGVSIARV